MLSLILVKKILSLFMVLGGGVLLVRTGIADTKESSILSKMSLYMIMPCVIISSYEIDYDPAIRDGLVMGIVVSIAIHITYIFLTLLLRKPLHLNPIEETAVIYTNSGNLIMPLVTAMLGKEMLIYTSAYISVQQFLFWSHAKMVISREKEISFGKIFKNINMIAIGIGLIIFGAHIRFPDFVKDGIDITASLAGPAAMMVTGMIIGGMDFSKLKKYKRVWLVVFLRLVIYSLVAMVVVKYSGATTMIDGGKEILLVTLLATITPTASTINQMAQVYGSYEDAEYSSSINVISTLGCVITMPLIVALYLM